MKTTSIMLQNLCVPCACHCRYCLLSWSGQTVGVDYDRSQRYARRFHDWIGENRPELSFNFSFGYSMDHPKLFEALAFLQSIGSVSGEFLQCDGLRFRHEDEIEALMQGLTSFRTYVLGLDIPGCTIRQVDEDHITLLTEQARGEVNFYAFDDMPEIVELSVTDVDFDGDPKFFLHFALADEARAAWEFMSRFRRPQGSKTVEEAYLCVRT